MGHELEFFIRLLKLVERCCEKSVYTGRGINLEKCVFSGCNITFVVRRQEVNHLVKAILSVNFFSRVIKIFEEDH